MKPLVGIIMGSKSDWDTLQSAADTLQRLGVPFETRVVSAHRTPDLLFEYAGTARELAEAGAGSGAAGPLWAPPPARTGLPEAAVMVSATHTHSAPVTVSTFFNPGETLDQAYMTRLASAIDDAVARVRA